MPKSDLRDIAREVFRSLAVVLGTLIAVPTGILFLVIFLSNDGELLSEWADSLVLAMVVCFVVYIPARFGRFLFMWGKKRLDSIRSATE